MSLISQVQFVSVLLTGKWPDWINNMCVKLKSGRLSTNRHEAIKDESPLTGAGKTAESYCRQFLGKGLWGTGKWTHPIDLAKEELNPEGETGGGDKRDGHPVLKRSRGKNRTGLKECGAGLWTGTLPKACTCATCYRHLSLHPQTPAFPSNTKVFLTPPPTLPQGNGRSKYLVGFGRTLTTRSSGRARRFQVL